MNILRDLHHMEVNLGKECIPIRARKQINPKHQTPGSKPTTRSWTKCAAADFGMQLGSPGLLSSKLKPFLLLLRGQTCGFEPDSNGLQPNNDGLQPKSNVLLNSFAGCSASSEASIVCAGAPSHKRRMVPAGRETSECRRRIAWLDHV